MIFNTPYGFWALLALVVLLIIYLIKQNYQQRIISTTFVWRQSFKYLKKRLPLNKFRNILIFVCQVLLFVVCAFILAWPMISGDITAERNEKILIIDGAANMLAVRESGETRFEYAVSLATEYGLEAMEKSGRVTVILAGGDASYEIARTDSEQEFLDTMQALVRPNNLKCSYSVADIDGAMNLAERVMIENALSEVVFFTATTFVNSGSVTLVNVDEAKLEYNLAILDAKVKPVENFFDFEIEVASFNKDMPITIEVDITDAVTLDSDGIETKHTNLNIQTNVVCSGNRSEFVTISERITEYGEVRVSILDVDSFVYDNEVYLYGSKKETIKVLYTSPKPNPFVDGALMSVRQTLRSHWNMEINNFELREGEFILEGYDFYIFEHELPGELPTDGVTLIINPDTTAVGLGLVVGDKITIEGQGDNLTDAGSHPITNHIKAENILITEYMKISAYDDYVPLMYYVNQQGESDPVLLVKNELTSRIAVLAFSVHYSDLPVLMEFPTLMYNIFTSFLPTTVDGRMYNVGDSIELRSRGVDLTVSGPGLNERYEPVENAQLTVTIKPHSYGTYAFEQTLISGLTSQQNIYVRINKSESDFAKIEYELANPYVPEGVGLPISIDLVIVLASILVGLLFVEWWLQNREQN